MNDNYKTQIGQRIKQLRESKGFSQETLGELIEMDPPSISKLENGKNSPSLFTLMKIMKALKVEPNEFFECEHIMNDIELEKEVIINYRKLNKTQQQFVFRMIKYILEQN